MDISSFDMSGLLADIPTRYELWVALFIISCKLVTVFVPPPQEKSFFSGPYRLIAFLGLNIGWAATHLRMSAQPSKAASSYAKEAEPSPSPKSGDR
ncbi:hypothetical protein [Gluconobacter morbifer]|uniref:Uncharacterized protein n=1 Tax=Gluconobacter morbifer G707 TaxID=1088869 RepID=G6XK23_9PROT|nr:hypothetical protein [Gluconobacter morbifer]EHH67985.1 hypothetical protein GMO_17520 [Gluconobacter morbifer G707]